MPPKTSADLALCHEVERLGFVVTTREVRTLREYGVIETAGNRRGGRGKVAPYVAGSARVVAAVEKAKRDPTYRRKLWRAVLIAWRRGANVGTPGLRRAFAQHYDHEERTTQNLVDGRRVEGEPDFDLPPAFYRAIGAARLGLSRSADDVAALEKTTGELVRVAFWRSGQRQLLPADPQSVGLAAQRQDGSWTVSGMGDRLWDALAVAPRRHIARTAPREELDAALPLAAALPRMHGLNFSDLVIACNTPAHVQRMRQEHGDGWWHHLGESPPGSQ